MKTSARLTLFILLLLVGLRVAVLFSEPHEEALSAYEQGDFATALEIWRSLADEGDARGQNGLGAMYLEGKGVLQDHVEAEKWFRRLPTRALPRRSSTLV